MSADQEFLNQVVRGVARDGKKIAKRTVERAAGWPKTAAVPEDLRRALQSAYDKENGLTGKFPRETQDQRFVIWFKVRAAFIARDFGLTAQFSAPHKIRGAA